MRLRENPEQQAAFLWDNDFGQNEQEKRESKKKEKRKSFGVGNVA